MFTNEFDFDKTITTILDESGELPDVQLTILDDLVTIKQVGEDEAIDLVLLTPKMFKDLLEAMSLPEGFYKTKYTYKSN